MTRAAWLKSKSAAARSRSRPTPSDPSPNIACLPSLTCLRSCVARDIAGRITIPCIGSRGGRTCHLLHSSWISIDPLEGRTCVQALIRRLCVRFRAEMAKRVCCNWGPIAVVGRRAFCSVRMREARRSIALFGSSAGWLPQLVSCVTPAPRRRQPLAKSSVLKTEM